MKCLLILGAIFALASGEAVEKWYRSRDGSHFFIESDKKFNWYNAWNECARKNMSLMAIDSPRKNYQVETLMKGIFPNSPSLWLSGNDMGIDKRYEWSTTGEMLTFTNWASGQPPPESPIDRCIAIWENTWTWHVKSCTMQLGFICEENRFIKTKSKEMDTLRKACYNTTATTFENVVVYVNSDIKQNMKGIEQEDFLKLNMRNITGN